MLALVLGWTQCLPQGVGAPPAMLRERTAGFPQKTGRPGLRRGGVGGYNLHSVPPNSPPDCGTPTTSRLYPFGLHISFSTSRSPHHRSPPHILLLGPLFFPSLPAHHMSSAIFSSPCHSIYTQKHMDLCFFCPTHTEIIIIFPIHSFRTSYWKATSSDH